MGADYMTAEATQDPARLSKRLRLPRVPAGGAEGSGLFESGMRGAETGKSAVFFPCILRGRSGIVLALTLKR